jgi:hypothetical protein
MNATTHQSVAKRLMEEFKQAYPTMEASLPDEEDIKRLSMLVATMYGLLYEHRDLQEKLKVINEMERKRQRLQQQPPEPHCTERNRQGVVEECGNCQQHGTNSKFCWESCPQCIGQREAREEAQKRVRVARATRLAKAELYEVKAAPKQVRKEVAKPPTPPPMPPTPHREIELELNKMGNFKTEKFLSVTFTLKDTDLAPNGANIATLKGVLAENFMALTLLSGLPCEGWLYVHEYTKSGVPHLHGMVRLSTAEHTTGYISATDTIFKGRNNIVLRGKRQKRDQVLVMLKKPEDVYRWVEYLHKEGEVVGNRAEIMEGLE